MNSSYSDDFQEGGLTNTQVSTRTLLIPMTDLRISSIFTKRLA